MITTDANFIIKEIEKSGKKLNQGNLRFLTKIKNKLSINDLLSKSDSEGLMILYNRATEIRPIKWGNSVRP